MCQSLKFNRIFILEQKHSLERSFNCVYLCTILPVRIIFCAISVFPVSDCATVVSAFLMAQLELLIYLCHLKKNMNSHNTIATVNDLPQIYGVLGSVSSLARKASTYIK